MDSQLDSEIRALNAQRDAQLRDDLRIPNEKREALRSFVLRRQEEQMPLSGASRYVVHLFAAIQGHARVPIAPACAVLIVTTYLSLGWFVTGRSHHTAVGDRSGADQLVPARGEQTSLSLRIGAAQLTQLQTGLLAQHRAFVSVGMEDVTLASLDLATGIRLDGGLELAP